MLRQKLRLYLARSDTQLILLRPVWLQLREALARVQVLARVEYSAEDSLVFAHALQELTEGMRALENEL